MRDDNPRDLHDKGNSGQANGDAAHDAEPLIVTIEPQTKNKYSYGAKQYRLDRARYRLEKKAYCTAKWTMVFLIVYTFLTSILAVTSIISAYATKKAFRAMNAGVIRPDIGIAGKNIVNVSFANKGKGSALKITARYRLSIQTIPDGKIIWSSDWRNTYSEIVQAGEGLENPNVVEGFNTEYLPLLSASKEAVRAEGTFRYNDGFDNVGPVNFCVMLSGNLGTPGRFKCDDLGTYLESTKQN